MFVVAADLRLLLFMLRQRCAVCSVLYDVPHKEQKRPNKLYIQLIIRVYRTCLVRKVPINLVWEKKYFTLVVFWHRVIDRCFLL